jgi:CRISPR/Cas system CSM-associated protein Csm3 (group 7 of RAMP superfamily)
MIKISHIATAKQTIFTGSDEDAGTMKTLRREKVAIINPIKHQSWFKTENSRRAAMLWILEEIWKKINFEDMVPTRRMKIWDEFATKMLAATRVRTRFQFLNEFAKSFNIKALSDPNISDLIQRFSNNELLTLLRDEQQFLILLLRNKRDALKERIKQKDSNELDEIDCFDEIEYGFPAKDFTESHPSEKKGFNLKRFGRNQNAKEDILMFSKSFDRIPYISGNSIRGLLRRLVMRDFCERIKITKLDKQIYHQLFTGGNITDSTMFEDIAQREKYIAMCPMIGLFGSAIGNMTIEGEMKMGAMRPLCLEHGNGESSFWEFLGTEFGTRRDDSKLERDIKLVAGLSAKKESAQQMKYGYEVFIKGTQFSHQIICSTYNKLIKSAFFHMLELFKQNPFIGGQSTTGNGELKLGYDIPENANTEYLNYLQDNQIAIQEYFKT